MNLFLYIPSHSAHPPNSTYSLIYGLMKTYMIQNSYLSDFITTVNLLFERLLDRGYQQEDLKLLFVKAMEKLLDEFTMNQRTKNSKRKEHHISSTNLPLFFHLPYNPRDVSRSQIRMIYEDECETQKESADNFKMFLNQNTGQFMRIRKLTLAYHRPTNLQDLLVLSTLPEIKGKEVSLIMKELP